MNFISEEHIAHHGIKGQKWGVRRYQNSDGTLTKLGKKRFSKDSSKLSTIQKKAIKSDSRLAKRVAISKKYEARPLLLKTDFGIARVRNTAARAQTRAEKRTKQAISLYNTMAKRYGSAAMSSLSKDTMSRVETILNQKRIYDQTPAIQKYY